LAWLDVGALAAKATAAAERREAIAAAETMLRHSVWMRRERLSHPYSIVGCNGAWETSAAS
jgi:hypothetical protein